MNTRSLFRFALLGLMAGAVPVACTVQESKDTCADEEYADCSCPDGYTSQKECNADNDGWKACECVGHEGGGGSNGGGGEANGTAGDNTNPGTAGSGTSYGGDTGDTGGVASTVGGATSEAGAGGGGGGDDLPLECQDPQDTCETCYFTCCTEWSACFNDETCLSEFNDVLACVNVTRDDHDVKPPDLVDCTNTVGDAGGSWSGGLTPETIAMVNCLAGDPAVSTWDQEPAWGGGSCNNSCFKK